MAKRESAGNFARRAFMATLACASLVAHPAAAQETADLIDGGNIDAVIQVARAYGSAVYETQANGNPAVAGRINGVPYYVSFLNCETAATCQDLNFFAGFLDIKPTLDQINTWNNTKRFSRAYTDPDGDAVIEMDVNLRGGISRDNLDSHLSNWRLILNQFTDFVGFK